MQKHLRIKLYLFFFFLVATVGFAIMFPRLTLPFGFAYIIYLMTKPLTSLLTTGPIKQRVLYFSLFTLGICFSLLPFFATVYSVDTDFGRLTDQLPVIQKVLNDKYFKLKVYLFENFGLKLNIDPVSFIIIRMEKLGALLLGQFPNYLSSLFEWMLLVPMFLYFFFVQSRKIGREFMAGIPNSIFEKAYVLYSHFNTKFGEYIIAKFIEAAILGTIVTMGLFIIGFPYPFILGFVAGVTNILPYIGPVIGYLPSFVVALISDNPNASLMAMSVIYIIANLIDMVLVFPLLVSKIVNLDPIIVVVSVIVGSEIGGIVGMIVVVPFIAFFKILFKEIYKDLGVQL